MERDGGHGLDGLDTDMERDGDMDWMVWEVTGWIVAFLHGSRPSREANIPFMSACITSCHRISFMTACITSCHHATHFGDFDDTCITSRHSISFMTVCITPCHHATPFGDFGDTCITSCHAISVTTACRQHVMLHNIPYMS